MESDWITTQYITLFEAAQEVWNKGMITISDHHDDEAAARLAACLCTKYERKYPD